MQQDCLKFAKDGGERIRQPLSSLKIAIINGSPKGKRGLTFQYARRVMQVLSGHSFTVLHVGQKIEGFQRNLGKLQQALDAVDKADCILWCTPVYYMLVPSQLKRFIELVFERGGDNWCGKFAATLTTSIHFHDNLAHRYLRAVSEDLGMRFVADLSAEMDDMVRPEGLDRLDGFSSYLGECMQGGLSAPRRYSRIEWADREYWPKPPEKRLPTPSKKIMILTDRGSANLDLMVRRLGDSFIGGAEVVDIRAQGPKTGCLGCIRCGYDNRCIQDAGDGFCSLYLRLIREVDCVVYAGTITDRWLSSVWKKFLDRSFFMGHIPALQGKQVAVIISGPLRQMSDLTEMIEAYFECQRAHLVDIVTDEDLDRGLVDQQIHGLAERLVWCTDNNYQSLPTFLGEGGWKVIRDAIWGKLRHVFEADHSYCTRHKMYDFPQDNFKARLVNLLMMTAKKSKHFRKVYDRRIIDEITKKSRCVLESQKSGKAE